MQKTFKIYTNNETSIICNTTLNNEIFYSLIIHQIGLINSNYFIFN